MGHVLIGLHVAFEALLGTRALCLGSGRRHSDLMHVMAGGARYAFGKMFGLLPVDVLLGVCLGELIALKGERRRRRQRRWT